MKHVKIVLLFFSVLLSISLNAQTVLKEPPAKIHPTNGAKKSFYHLVTSNGLIAAVYNEKQNIIENVRPHIFQAYDSARYVEPFINKMKPDFSFSPEKIYYEGNTHVITTDFKDFKISYFAPFTTEEKVFYAVISGPSNKISSYSFSIEKNDTKILVDSAQFERKGNRLDKYFLFSFTDSLHRDDKIVAKAKQHLIEIKGRLLQDEISFMKRLFAKCRIPKKLSPSERALVEQSISVLKMAQVSDKEVFPLSRGQVLASLPPGHWNIAWVRDGAYAILGMNKLGMFDESRRAFDFMLNAESSHYEHYVHSDGKDYGVGMPYKISVCRYFGMGKEESDYEDKTGPNIELDGFGLSLTAFCDYVERSGDKEYFRKNYETVAGTIADVIIHCIDSNNLIHLDSGPWERHLPGKQYAYTSIACAAGLRDFANLSAKMHIKDAAKYNEAYQKLLGGIKSNLIVDNKFIKCSNQASDPSKYEYFDGASFEAFSSGLINDKTLFQSHLNEYSPVLKVQSGINGFSRVNKGNSYDTAEWIVLDMRAAKAMKLNGDLIGARRLVDWVTQQASLNFNLIPELLNEKSSNYSGAIPMVGFGAGVYVITLLDLYK